jgi:hypothetical protein
MLAAMSPLRNREAQVDAHFNELGFLEIRHRRITLHGLFTSEPMRVITIIDRALIKIIDGNFSHEGSTGGLFSLPPGVTMRRWLLRRREATGCHHQRRIQGTSQPSRRQRSTAA